MKRGGLADTNLPDDKRSRVGSIHPGAAERLAEMAGGDVPDAKGDTRLMASIIDLLDKQISSEARLEARLVEIEKQDASASFFPEWKAKLSAEDKIFRSKWVPEKMVEGVCKARLTCADVKHNYTKEEEAELDILMPPPASESHILLELTALLFQWPMEEADVVAAFLIGLDQAAAKGRPVFLYPPSEWNLQEWLKGKSAELKN